MTLWDCYDQAHHMVTWWVELLIFLLLLHQKNHYFISFHYGEIKNGVKTTLTWRILRVNHQAFCFSKFQGNKMWLISIWRLYILTTTFFLGSDDGWCLSCHNIGFIPSLRHCGKTLIALCRSLGFFYLFTFKISITIHEILLSHMRSLPGVFPTMMIAKLIRITPNVN